MTAWHSRSAAEALEELGCDRKRGLSGEGAERRLREHGPNALRQKKPRGGVF